MDDRRKMIRDYTKIKAWQLADKLALMVYEITTNFPRSEIWGLTSQIRRSAVSVATNIVEGATRKSQNEYMQFLYIAFSSLSEVGYLCKFAYKIGYIGSNTYNEFELKHNEVAKTLRGLINYLERSNV